jgi:hypothetical protein
VIDFISFLLNIIDVDRAGFVPVCEDFGKTGQDSIALKNLLSALAAQPPVSFVPADFAVPAGFESAGFRLRMLTVNDVVKDFEAVMTSAAHLKELFPHEDWADGLTLEQNLIELGWHQREFQNRTLLRLNGGQPV